jgi:hypothetical protein
MEPERNIEKILRAAAKKRGEQAGEPFELHPAARQELLREAAKRGAKKSGGGFFAQMFSGFGPRMAMALTVVVVVVVGIWLARPLLNEKGKASTLAMANRQADQPVAQNEPARNESVPALAPLSGSSPAIATAEIAEEARARTAAPVAGARRDSGEPAAKDEALPAAALQSAPSGGAEVKHKVTPNFEAPKPVGVAQPTVALNDLSKSKAPMAPPSTPPAVTYQNNQAVDSLAASAAADKAATGSVAPPGVANAAPATIYASADREARKELKLAAPQPSVNTGQVANFDNAANNTVGGNSTLVTQRFYRVVAVPTVRQRGFGGGSPSAPLLASFQMEQNGQGIRVVDADGSVYTGSWQVASEQNAVPVAGGGGGFHFSGAIPAASSVRAAPPSPAANNNLQAMQNYFFNVSGTNRNLKQRITFSGNFIPLSNVLNTANNAVAGGGTVDGRNAAQLNATPPVLLNSRIAGKAVIGGIREIEVNANPLP